MASVIAFRGRNAIIDLTAYPIGGEEDVVIPGISDTVINLMKKNYIVFFKLKDELNSINFYPVNTYTASGNVKYYDYYNGDNVLVQEDTFVGSGGGD
jgi:hypothetical protein